jgi:hypothetical protein
MYIYGLKEIELYYGSIQLETATVWHLVNISSNKNKQTNNKLHERTMPTEQPPLVGEVSANFCG